MKTLFNRVLQTFLLLLALAGSQVNGQETASPKALKYFEKAQGFYERGEWSSCENELIRAIEADSTFAMAYIMLGDVLQESGRLELAAEQYRKALRFKPDREVLVYNMLANTLFSLEKYGEAGTCYAKVLDYQDISKDLRNSIENKLEISELRYKLMENPVAFDPVNLGPTVNSSADEYINVMAADGMGIFFTRKMKSITDPNRNFVEDFYFAIISDDSLENASLLDYPPGKQDDAGAICISPDGRLLFFTACFRAENYGSCDLYFSEKTGDTWSVARNMGAHINSEYWDTQPSISPDGKTLYFTSKRPGGQGGADIWKTDRLPDGNWSKPVNLGPPVNTPGPEMAPFIHFDNQTLYFASAGHPGMGGADLFKSVRLNNAWSEPENVGYPINSLADELVIVVNPEGNRGLISNNNLAGFGGYDIYEFELDESIKPIPVSYLKGKVYDRNTGVPLEATFEMIDVGQNSTIIDAKSDRQNGEFLVCVPVNRNYALNVSCPGYLFYSDHFPLSEIKSRLDPVIRDIPLEPVAAGNIMVLRNIFFNTDEYQLEPESFTELNKLFDFLRDNPLIRVEIGGHTDDQGTFEYNMQLSQKRAEAVCEDLVNKGVDKTRISCKGYGESEPVASNDTEQGRALNRRTEIKILETN